MDDLKERRIYFGLQFLKFHWLKGRNITEGHGREKLLT